MPVEVSGEGPQRPFLSKGPVAQTTAQSDVVVDQPSDRAGHDVCPGHGSATSRRASISTAA